MTIVIYICDEYQQNGDGVVVKTIVTVGVGWDQTGWRKISSFERQKIFNSIFPRKFHQNPKLLTGGGTEKNELSKPLTDMRGDDIPSAKA